MKYPSLQWAFTQTQVELSPVQLTGQGGGIFGSTIMSQSMLPPETGSLWEFKRVWTWVEGKSVRVEGTQVVRILESKLPEKFVCYETYPGGEDMYQMDRKSWDDDVASGRVVPLDPIRVLSLGKV